MIDLRQISPVGSSALAILELTGDDAEPFLRSLGVREVPAAGRMRLATLRIGTDIREQALLVGTERGHEIQMHGNPLLVEALLDRAGAQAPALAPESRSQVETLEESLLRLAREARGREALALVLYQLGDRGLLALLRGLAEGQEIQSRRLACEEALTRAAASRALLRSYRIVLRGPVNAGKSTLFNLLVGRERVRTGPTPALTRDSIQEELLYRGHSLILVDTAGESRGLCGLDREAQTRSAEQQRSADLMLWLHAYRQGAPAPTTAERPPVLWVETHHPRPDLERLRLDLVSMEPGLVRQWILDRVLATLELSASPDLAPAALDERMQAELRWLLTQQDPVGAARTLLTDRPRNSGRLGRRG